MPITLNCPCGKTLRIADEHAGKRVKCPACNAILTSPEPEPKFEIVEEAPRKIATAVPRALPRATAATADEDEEDVGYNMESAAKKPDPPKKKPNFRKSTDDEDEEDDPLLRRRRRSNSGASSGRRIAYVVGGALGIVAGIALAMWGNNGTGRGATKLMVFGICIGIASLVCVYQGLTGNMPEGE